jgi:hypothetical protein
MSGRKLGLLVALLLLAAAPGRGAAQQPVATPPAPPRVPAAGHDSAASESPRLEKLGDERYRIGTVVLDRKRRSLSVPGRVIHLDDAPLEYVAVGSKGFKAYESVLELDATGSEINLACILIGLDAVDANKPKFQFDPGPAIGPAVALELRWRGADGAETRIAVHEALVEVGQGGVEHAVTDDWVYIGSYLDANSSRFMADMAGSIVGFVHDPASIVEHRHGLGIGAYGSVQVRKGALPPVGTAIELHLSVRADDRPR